MPKTKKPTSHKKQIEHKPKSYKKPLVILVIILLVLCILPWFFKYEYYRYAKCGREPVKVVPAGVGSDMRNYVTPEQSSYGNYTFNVVGYFCTEKEAMQAGLKSLYGDDGWFNSDSTPKDQIKW
jgi:hypothetical protein